MKIFISRPNCFIKMRVEFSLRKSGYLFCVLCNVLCLSYSYPNYNCSDICVGLEDSFENGSDSDVEEKTSTDIPVDVESFNFTGPSLRFATPCETPNEEVEYCIEISKCRVLNNVRNSKKYSKFIDASRCGPSNENQGDFKVCCGKYNSFRLNQGLSCNTPNNEDAYCVEIANCPVLNKVRAKAKYASFINASKCGTTNEDGDNIKVCCGKYNGFRNSSRALDNVLPKDCGTQRKIVRGRIVGGTEALLGEYPWMVRIINKNKKNQKSYGCGGFIIHRKFILTAGHCIYSEFSEIRGEPYTVVLGEHNVTTAVDCSPGGTICADRVQISRINKTIVHENYSNISKNHHNDIALIYLNKAIKMTDFVRPICLLKEEKSDVKKFFISGWGKTEKDEYSNVKLKVDLVPFDREECRNKFQLLGLDIHESQICAGGEKLKDSCNGDSGGPLMISNGSHHFAAGLVSYGIGCGMQGWPGVYTSVPTYLEWIKKQMQEILKENKKTMKRATIIPTVNDQN